MARIFITGSSTGLGLMAAQLLISQGHAVVLHGRDEARGAVALAEAAGAEAVVIGDLQTLAGMRAVAEAADRHGRFDAVIHNAAIGYREPRRIETVDGLPQLFAVNLLAPYVLTAMMQRPNRLVYLGSGMHYGVEPMLDDLLWTRRRWSGAAAYAESKLYDTVLAYAVTRRWPDILSTALEPGWVPTRMGGPGAPDDMDQAHRTQAWLAVSDDTAARVSGAYFYHLQRREPNPAVQDEQVQDALLAACARLSQVAIPR
jgi:NAD(P)-dependent dehydrogenase (short-subunit alcohol dehydrogenase family)